MTMGAFPVGLEESEPEAAFLRGLRNRLGFDPTRTIFGRQLAQQQAPFQTAFSFENLLAPFRAAATAPATPPDNPFLAFTEANTLPGVRGQARNLFGELRNATGGADTVRQQFAQPDESQAANLRNLAVTGLMSRISPLALGLLNIPTGGDLRSQFLAEQPEGNDFINFLRSRIGLGVL